MTRRNRILLQSGNYLMSMVLGGLAVITWFYTRGSFEGKLVQEPALNARFEKEWSVADSRYVHQIAFKEYRDARDQAFSALETRLNNRLDEFKSDIRALSVDIKQLASELRRSGRIDQGD